MSTYGKLVQYVNFHCGYSREKIEFDSNLSATSYCIKENSPLYTGMSILSMIERVCFCFEIMKKSAKKTLSIRKKGKRIWKNHFRGKNWKAIEWKDSKPSWQKYSEASENIFE